MKLCDQALCCLPAVYRYTWPGRSERLICETHVGKLRETAAALDFTLEVIPLRQFGATVADFVAQLESPAMAAARYGAAIGEKMQKHKPCARCGHGEPFHFDRFCSPELLASMPKHVDGSCRMKPCDCSAYEAVR